MAIFEKRLLIWMAQTQPARINSDHLTALGFGAGFKRTLHRPTIFHHSCVLGSADIFAMSAWMSVPWYSRPGLAPITEPYRCIANVSLTIKFALDQVNSDAFLRSIEVEGTEALLHSRNSPAFKLARG